MRLKPFTGQRNKLLMLAAGFGIVAVGLTLSFNQIVGHLSPKTQSKNDLQLPKDRFINLENEKGISQTIASWEKNAQLQMRHFPIPKQFEGQTFAEVKLNSKEKVIALTFDDGPWEKGTEQIMAILRRDNIKATFFVVGQYIQLYPQIAKKIVAEGHVIANHTWSHSPRKLSVSAAAREIDRTSELIYKTTGVKTSLFRPPFGLLHNGVVDYAKKKKYGVVMWSVDSKDWARPSAQTMVNTMLQQAKPGGIALMHDGGGPRSHTIQALPKVIAELKKRDYKFVTIPQLLEMKDAEEQVAAKKK